MEAPCEERRRHHRFPVTCELRHQTPNPLERGEKRSFDNVNLLGVITDIGAGGIGIFSDDLIDVWDPFVCQIIVPQMRIGIPTLLQRRWALKDGQGHSYRVGLQFLV